MTEVIHVDEFFFHTHDSILKNWPKNLKEEWDGHYSKILNDLETMSFHYSGDHCWLPFP